MYLETTHSDDYSTLRQKAPCQARDVAHEGSILPPSHVAAVENNCESLRKSLRF